MSADEQKARMVELQLPLGGDTSVDEILKKHRAKLPLSYNTAYRCMLQCGAEFREYAKSYYNDTHEAKATVQYRNDVYIPTMNALQQRAPVWVTVPIDKASKEAIADAKTIWNIPEDKELDTVYKQFNGIWYERYQVHVDFLAEEDFEDIRCARYLATGVSGEYHERFAKTLNGKPTFTTLPLSSAMVVDDNDDARPTCRFGHDPAVCRCHLPSHFGGQDETCLYQHTLSPKT